MLSVLNKMFDMNKRDLKRLEKIADQGRSACNTDGTAFG